MQSACHFCSIIAKLEFDENPNGGCRVDPCGRVGVTKLILVYRNFVKAPEKTSKEKDVNRIRLLTTVFTEGTLWAQHCTVCRPVFSLECQFQ